MTACARTIRKTSQRLDLDVPDALTCSWTTSRIRTRERTTRRRHRLRVLALNGETPRGTA
ncbi:hypothetical protein [Kineococcus mangrovi]|uniref:hypothetical protein n=1 Tax=Kineococcus mangrovi TaxID=1660183 RepID=UPI003522ECD0